MRWIILCLVLLVSAGVAPGGEAPDLSDAMKKSATGDKTPVDTGSHSHHPHGGGDDYDPGDAASDSLAGEIILGMLGAFHGVYYEDDLNYVWQLPLDAAYIVPLNGDIQGMTRFSITPFSVEGEHVSVGLYFNGGLVNFKHGSLPDAAADGAHTFGFGLNFHYFFRKAEETWSPYISTSLGWQQLAWTYRNPVITTGGDTIDNDSLNGLDTYMGFGVAFRRSERFTLFSEAGFGGSILSSKTDEGFHNDVFDDFAYFSVKAGLTLKF